MLRLSFLAIVTSLGVVACTLNPYSEPSNLRFQESKEGRTQIVNIKRDNKLCSGDTTETQNCPINFYIDSIEAGVFYINNSAKYYLKPETYSFKVKNCSSAKECKSCDVDLSVNNSIQQDFILSVDGAGKPFILNNGQPLSCSVKTQDVANIIPSVERTVKVDLAADTLFKFNGSSLNDLLPKGHQEISDVATKISTGFASVRQIKLVGHTDRLGSDTYNMELGQKRAETVRNLLIEKGVSKNIISATSSGEQQPVTDGCPNIKSHEALKTCLQPDRRVTVEITGISK